MSKKLYEYYAPTDGVINISKEASSNFLNRYNYVNSNQVIEYARGYDVNSISRKLIEAWMWLEHEGLVCPSPEQPYGNVYFVTEKGFRFREPTSFESFKKSRFLLQEVLDKVLVEKVYPLFLSGDYDTAVFRAFKEVEVRVRDKANLPLSTLGTDLMRTAFNPEKGLLSSKNIHNAEKQAVSDLFAGSIALFKNPSSHREVEFEQAEEVAKIILFADYLLKLIDRL